MALPVFYQPTPQSVNGELLWMDSVTSPTRVIVSYGGSAQYATKPVALALTVGDTVSMSWVGPVGAAQTLRVDGVVAHAPADATNVQS